MTTTLIPIEQARNLAPRGMQARMQAGTALSNRFADNVQDAFPRLSIKGKVFRVRLEGQEMIARDPQTGHPYAFLDVVLLNASQQLAKTYYIKGFTEGDMNPPDCWSLDSIRPDPSVANKVNPTCLDCPKNAFGSRMTPDGKAAKACADSRRVAVVMPHDILSQAPVVYLLRVPQASLKNLKNYAVDKLARNGYEPGGCVSRLSFDPQAAFPKLQFEFVGPVTDDEFESVVQLANSPHVNAMLLAPDFDNVASAVNATQTQVAEPPQRQAAPQLTPDTGAQVSAGTSYTAPQREAQIVQPAQQEQPQTQQQAPVTQQEEWITLPTGELLNPATGEVKPAPQQAEPEIDPDVIVIADGRFYHRTKGRFVDSQYKDAGTTTGTPQQAAPAKEAKATRTRKKTEPAKDQQAAAKDQETPPETTGDNQKSPNGDGSQPVVVAASPRLEQLLGGLTPPAK